ncbi:MAG TPA: hypothetical protein DC046_16730 [Rhodospirillaceae bacterium]|nr:hypothetical protein [Rhodospirillaceae bacterium]
MTCRLLKRISVLTLTLMVLAACTVRLAPEHEQAIVDGLQALSSETETLFVSVREGTKTVDYASKRKDVYDKLIGKAQGLMVLVDVRPEPKPALTRWFGSSTADNITKDNSSGASLWQDIKSLDVPTDDQLKWYIDEVERMRTADSKVDLPAEAMAAFGKPIRRALKNAIVYEMALER